MDGHNATHCPDLCQLSEFDNLRWHGELEETTFLSINYVALTCSSIPQFNMDIIKSWSTVCSFLWCFSFIVWQNNNGLITKTKVPVIITLSILRWCWDQTGKKISLFYIPQAAKKNPKSCFLLNIKYTQHTFSQNKLLWWQECKTKFHNYLFWWYS